MSEKVKIIEKGAPFGGAYFVACVGAAVYFIQNTSGFWGVIGAMIKGLLWPGFLIHRAFELMNV